MADFNEDQIKVFSIYERAFRSLDTDGGNDFFYTDLKKLMNILSPGTDVEDEYVK